jgi:hypothetical protein
MKSATIPQLDRIRQALQANSASHVSIDDEDMREYDVNEHRETLGGGIPSYLAQKTGPRYVRPRDLDTSDDEATSSDVCAVDDIGCCFDTETETGASGITSSPPERSTMTSSEEDIRDPVTSSPATSGNQRSGYQTTEDDRPSTGSHRSSASSSDCAN